MADVRGHQHAQPFVLTGYMPLTEEFVSGLFHSPQVCLCMGELGGIPISQMGHQGARPPYGRT